VERTAEAIGADIAARQQREIRRAKQLDLPLLEGANIPFLYIQVDGTGVPVVTAETEGRKGKVDGQPAHTREVKLGCVFTQTKRDAEGRPRSKPPKSSDCASIRKPGAEAGHGL